MKGAVGNTGSSNRSSTPKSSVSKKKRPVVRTQRRNSSIGRSPSPARSKKKSIKVVRKSPAKQKQSPSLAKTLQRKRQRVRRATADPANLQKQIEQQQEEQNHSDSDASDEYDAEDDNVQIAQHSDSENHGDYKNSRVKQRRKSNINYNERKFVCEQKPETMTILNLKKWLDKNNIEYAPHERKAVYVALVDRYCIVSPNSVYSKKRVLSPEHKKKNSPEFKKSKPSSFDSPIRSAPMPRNLRKSPLTPQEEKKKKKGGLLLTPSLNKTGILKVDTPSKLAMRDEIRSLIFSGDESEGPLMPVKDSYESDADGVTPGGPTPGGPLDAQVMADLRRDILAAKQNETPIKVFAAKKKKDDDLLQQQQGYIGANMQREEEEEKQPSGFFNSIIAKFSPHKSTSSQSKQDELRKLNILTTQKKKRQIKASPYKAKRSMPSPVSPPQSYGQNNGNYDIDKLTTPHDPYSHHKTAQHVHFYEDEPMSPAIQTQKRPNMRRSKRLEQEKIDSPPHSVPIKQSHVSPQAAQVHTVPESPGIAPSIPQYMQSRNRSAKKKNLSPVLPYQSQQNT